ncbi:hypothetical protein GOBAR_DD36825 [Gossypium barbadense]|nr:hypothetical protein GOBAR_DD36825 [Gossypium barbadense]
MEPWLDDLADDLQSVSFTSFSSATVNRSTSSGSASNSGSSSLAPSAHAKVMDKKELASRSKEGRARTEVEILKLLDHPFLPSLYAAIDSPKWLCLLTEFCPGGDLHVLRQHQPLKRFPESAVRYILPANR